MQGDDFFIEVDGSWGPNSEPWQTRLELNRELLHSLSLAPVAGHNEVEAAQGLADLVYEELGAFGTSGGERLDDQDIALAIKAMQAVLARLAIPSMLPFRDFTRFRSYWIRHGAAGHQARRDILEGLFEPVIARLAHLEQVSLDDLAAPVSAMSTTGWPGVDEEISELRRRFRTSTTTQDYRAIGTHCVGVIEALSRTVYDPTRHLRPGETEPPVDKSKQRLDRYIEDALPGAPNEELRGLAKSRRCRPPGQAPVDPDTN